MPDTYKKKKKGQINDLFEKLNFGFISKIKIFCRLFLQKLNQHSE